MHRYLANNRVGFFQSDEALSSSKFCTVFSGDLSRTSFSLPPASSPPRLTLSAQRSVTHTAASSLPRAPVRQPGTWSV